MEVINARTGINAPDDLLGLIQTGVDALRDLPPDLERLPLAEVTPVLPYDVPPKIWLIGLITSRMPKISMPCNRRSREAS